MCMAMCMTIHSPRTLGTIVLYQETVLILLPSKKGTYTLAGSMLKNTKVHKTVKLIVNILYCFILKIMCPVKLYYIINKSNLLFVHYNMIILLTLFVFGIISIIKGSETISITKCQSLRRIL